MFNEIFDRGVYLGSFSPNTQTGETHLLSCIQEGLTALNIRICDNPEDSNLNIIDISFISNCHEHSFDLLPYLGDCEVWKHKSLFLNISDFAPRHYISYPSYWLISAHTTEFVGFPSGTRIPWGFGFQQRLLNLTDNLDFTQPRKRVIIRNFKPSFNQSVRESLDLVLLPQLEKVITIDKTIEDDSNHTRNDNFLTRLLDSRFCLAYCGQYGSNVLLNPYIHNLLKDCQLTYSQDVFILRWDSWRLWESWVMGCIPITLDFEKYGFQLPVMPDNWQHYIGLDLGKLEEDVNKLLSLSESELDEISLNGREWVIENYSPKAVAERFLTIGVDKIIGSVSY
jgi:hypothetical protein